MITSFLLITNIAISQQIPVQQMDLSGNSLFHLKQKISTPDYSPAFYSPATAQNSFLLKTQTTTNFTFSDHFNQHLAFFCRLEKRMSTFFDMDIDIGVK